MFYANPGFAALLFFAGAATAQSWYVGVKGGVPLSENEVNGFVGNKLIGGGPRRLLVRPYTIGPSVGIGLPWWGLGIEVDGLYKRADATERFTGILGTYVDRRTWNSWEFPMSIRREWRAAGLRPFVSAGGVVRFVPGTDYSVERLPQLPGEVSSSVSYRPERRVLQSGYVGSGGVRLTLWWALTVTPELRYTRYTSLRSLPTQNQFEFLLGLGYGRR